MSELSSPSERYVLQADLAKSSSGGLEACGITKYSASHSFNPLLISKSTQNLSIKKVEKTPCVSSLIPSRRND